MDAAVLTFATHAESGFCACFHSALAHGIRPKLLGWQTAPGGGALQRKVTAVAAEVAGYDDARIVVFVDAFDVLFVDDLATIVGRFLRMDKPIVFSAEKGCYPHEDLAAAYPASRTPWRFLNSGAYIGYAGPLKALFQTILVMPQARDGAMDQELAARAYLAGSSRIALDHDCEIFMNIHLSQWDVQWRNGRYRNRITGTQPCILHFNGNAKHDQAGFTRRLGHAVQPVDPAGLEPFEAGIVATHCAAAVAPAPSITQRAKAWLWPARAGIDQFRAAVRARRRQAGVPARSKG